VGQRVPPVCRGIAWCATGVPGHLHACADENLPDGFCCPNTFRPVNRYDLRRRGTPNVIVTRPRKMRANSTKSFSSLAAAGAGTGTQARSTQAAPCPRFSLAGIDGRY